MNLISYEIYGFTKNFLKLTSKPSWRGIRILFIYAILSILLLFSMIIKNVILIIISIIFLIVFLIIFWFYIRKIIKEDEVKNFLKIHSEKYDDFLKAFANRYGDEYGKKLVIYLEVAEKELEADIKIQIEKSKYILDKIVSLLTLSPLLTLLISFGRESQGSNYNLDFAIISFIFLFTLIAIINGWIAHIYSPAFSPFNDVANRQRVVWFLRGYLASGVFADNLTLTSQCTCSNKYYRRRRIK